MDSQFIKKSFCYVSFIWRLIIIDDILQGPLSTGIPQFMEYSTSFSSRQVEVKCMSI
jgi:hypothetical protein